MPSLRLRGREVERDRALVMAIVNRTPDSFFDRGATFEPSRAIDAVARARAAGAAIVARGGVQAGTGAEGTITEEISRTVPFIETVRDRFPDVAVSIDTWRAEVGDAAVRAGADLLNDTWAGVDPALGVVAADHGCGYVCSHTGGVRPRTDPIRARYDDVVADVIDETTAAAERLAGLGVPREGILIDPTHDFGKNTFHGLELLRRTDELVATGWPVLMALSRKDFVGETLDLGVGDRLEGTLAATAIAAWKGAAVFRAHDIVATRRVLEMIATLRGERPVASPRRGLA